MKSRLSMMLAMLALTSSLVVGCGPSQPSSPPDAAGGAGEQDGLCAETDPATCESHADCVCVEDDGCFLGNKAYYERCEEVVDAELKSSCMVYIEINQERDE